MTAGEAVPTTVAQQSDTWRTRARRQWPAITVYLLAVAATMWAVGWTVAAGQDDTAVAVLLVATATGTTVCSAIGITWVVRA